MCTKFWYCSTTITTYHTKMTNNPKYPLKQVGGGKRGPNKYLERHSPLWPPLDTLLEVKFEYRMDENEDNI